MSNIHVTIANKFTKRTEGDVWEERGKLWTIKNGIKRTITKMDQARKEFLTPLCCPNCSGPMKHPLDEKMWAIHKTCFPCVIEMEHKIRKSGKWDEYEKAKILANANGFVKDLEQFFNDYVKESVAKSNVTEDGMVEKWQDVGQTYIEDVTAQGLKNIKDTINDYNKTKDGRD